MLPFNIDLIEYQSDMADGGSAALSSTNLYPSAHVRVKVKLPVNPKFMTTILFRHTDKTRLIRSFLLLLPPFFFCSK